jgi:hypothetical protein
MPRGEECRIRRTGHLVEAQMERRLFESGRSNEHYSESERKDTRGQTSDHGILLRVYMSLGGHLVWDSSDQDTFYQAQPYIEKFPLLVTRPDIFPASRMTWAEPSAS